jgi:ribonuclease P protein component
MILKDGAEFRSIVQHGYVVKNEYFSIFFVQEDDIKVGFAAAKAPSKPLRNKLKRIARELWRTNGLGQQISAHIVIIAHMRVMRVKHDERRREFNNLLQMMVKRCSGSTILL